MLRGNQPELFGEAQRVLLPLAQTTPPEAETREHYQGKVITRQFWRTESWQPGRDGRTCGRCGWCARPPNTPTAASK